MKKAKKKKNKMGYEKSFNYSYSWLDVLDKKKLSKLLKIT
jgi:hypothetical protein